MESDKKIEIIHKAIRKLIEDDDAKTISSSNEDFAVLNEKPGGGRHHRQLLSKLLSELEESLEEVDNVSKEGGSGGSSSNDEEIVKELKKVRRQNMITHCLLTAMIVVTLAWQLSEVSLILKIKNGFSNPLKSVGGIIGGLLKNRRGVKVQDMMMKKQTTGKVPHLGMGLPLPAFDTSGDGDEDDD